MTMFSKIYKTLSLLKHWRRFANCDSYYPDDEHKSKVSVLLDQLFFIWKYGDVEPFYFTYGFDRTEMTRQRMTEEYLIPYSHFQKRIKNLNSNPPHYGSYGGKIILADKFIFYLLLAKLGIPTPKVFCFIKNHAPLFFDPEFVIDSSLPARDQMSLFLSNDMDAFVKPYAGEMGKGIFSMKISDHRIFIDGIETPESAVIEKLLSDSFLIQERIKQHPQMTVLCPSTLNTIRLQTVIDKSGRSHPFGAGLRIGRIWNSVDNWAKGGVFVGINMENGTLKSLGMLKPQFGTSTKKHPDTEVIFDKFEIPFYKEAESLAVKLHQLLYRCHSIGWDIAITERGPVFIEGNGIWEISLLQAVHGGLKKEIDSLF